MIKYMTFTIVPTWHLFIFSIILIVLIILLINIIIDDSTGDLGKFVFGVPTILLIILTIVTYGGIYWW